ncbi:MAG: hypothetical protein M5U13_11945 [Thermoanaerobaculia bacterium]|nr:hypothetical protein [Thermoanaerobaculia bacterium]
MPRRAPAAPILAPLLLLLLLAAAAPAAAGAGRVDPDLPSLPELGGDHQVLVRYTPGSLERAAHVQQRLVAFAAEADAALGGRNALQVYVLSRDEWESAGFERPFGMPEVTAGGALALPAFADEASVRLWRDRLGGALPPPTGRAVVASAQEAGALAAADTVGYADLARLLVERRPAAVDSPWLGELLVHLLARLPLARQFPEDLPAADAVLVGLVRAGGGDGARPLAAWRPGLPLGERLWFDGEFGRGAAALIADRGALRARRLLASTLKKGKPLAAGQLLEDSPALAGWLQVGFAP